MKGDGRYESDRKSEPRSRHQKGDVIMSVFIYGPDRKAYDDDLARYDWIIDRK